MSNLVLIGMPGCGKSTLGVILAKSMAYDFLDSDLLIQRKAGMPLQQIIDACGTAAFQRIENEVNAAIECDRTVIATGGSVIFCPEAMAHLKRIGTVVYIRVPYAEIERRVSNFKTRGLVLSENETLRDLYEERRALYEQYADRIIDWGDETAEHIVERIAHVANNDN